MQRIIAAVLVILMLCGCTTLGEQMGLEKEPETPAVVENKNTAFGVAYTDEAHFNPLTTKSKINLELYGLVYEGLFELDETFTPQNVLCESYSLDGNAYRFNLRRDVTFSDGSALTAEDVVFSLRLAMQAESYYAPRLSNIANIRTSGDAVIITVKSFNANLPRLLDVPIIKKSSGDSKISLGTGGYVISYDAQKKVYYLAARQGWYQQLNRPYARIEMVESGGVDELIYNFESMNVDLVTVDPTAPNPLQFRGEYETREYRTSVMQYLGFNTRRSPFDDSVIRQGMACAIDRKSAVEMDFARMADETQLPIHPANPAYDATAAKNFDYSPANAKAFFEIAGYRDENRDGKLDSGGKRSFDILVNSENKSRVALARRISANLNELGFNISVREAKWEDYIKSLEIGDFDLYIGEVGMSGDFRLDTLLHTGGALNYGRYASDETDKLLNSYNGATIGKNASIAEFYRHFVIQAPIVPLLFKKHTVITHRNFFEELTPTQRNTYYQFSKWKTFQAKGV